MLRNVCRQFPITPLINKRIPVRTLRVSEIRFNDKSEQSSKDSFDKSLLKYLVCPLSKKSLRYEEQTNELINDELGIAYPVVDGIPNLIPQDARKIHRNEMHKNDSKLE
ncbi:protein preY, mitochondrial-like [Erpetoichthys calabaricus]|uniref:Protein preY, mitochondrial n=1 Tax=Erpetoichthys calabaricus TaxID=27687 RepID=A0A8C4RWR8_ERPCA|nr:protein preY, mitochondrial-like [Erpetoichthys calabaricus]